jgi:hypothetical protein
MRWRIGSNGLLGAAIAISLLAMAPARAACPANTYQKGDKCEACPAGARSKAGSTSWTDCFCPKNTYIDGSDTCVKCPVGTFSEAESVAAKSVHVKEHCKPLKIIKGTFPKLIKPTPRCAPGTHARGAACVPNRVIMPKVVPRRPPPGVGAAPTRTTPPAGLMLVR